MKKSILSSLICLFAFLSTASAFASYEWGFANVSLNRLFWTEETKLKSPKRDFNYLELEGGAQFNWGELYGFMDIENIARSNGTGDAYDVRTAAKAVGRYYLGKSGISIYAHVYDFNAMGFSEQNRVLGLGYQLNGEGYWVKPFLGIHDVTQTYFNGINGFMGGWTIGYNFKFFEQDFMLSNWHELEFARKTAYAAGNGGKKMSQNGALGLWWNSTQKVSLGLQWRYSVDKLGTAGLSSAAIATLKYNF